MRMNILTVVEGPSWIDHHINDSLRSLGHKVSCYVYGSHVGEFYPQSRAGERARKNSELLQLARDLAKTGRLDLIFCYVYDDFLQVDTARALAGIGVAMVNFNVDMVNQWYRQLRTARYFTRMLCAHRTHMQQFTRHGAKPLYFPMAAPLPVPSQYQQEPCWQPAAAVTFVGTPMPYRTRVLTDLLQHGVPLAVYGKFWQQQQQASPERSVEKTLNDIRYYGLPRLRAEGIGSLLQVLRQRWQRTADSAAAETLPSSVLHGFVPAGELNTLFSCSAVNIGFTRMVGDDPARSGSNQMKLRDFEVPMAGGFYLVEQAPDYDQLFKPGVEVETWRTPGELRDKIRYYLEHPAERNAIAAAGAARARADHSWQQRFSTLFEELGLE